MIPFMGCGFARVCVYMLLRVFAYSVAISAQTSSDKPGQGGHPTRSAAPMVLLIVQTLTGKTITVNDVTTKTTIIDIKNMIAEKDGLPVRYQRVRFNNNKLKNGHTVGYYNIKKEDTLYLVGRLRGGGKVIKKVIKTKATETTTQSDRVFFEQSFSAAVAIHTFTDINLKESLLKMELDKLKELYVYLKHDKSVVAKKIEKLCEFLPEGIALEKAQHKINSAMDRLRNMTMTAMEEEDGTVNIKGLLELVSNRIAVIEAQGQRGCSRMDTD